MKDRFHCQIHTTKRIYVVPIHLGRKTYGIPKAFGQKNHNFFLVNADMHLCIMCAMENSFFRKHVLSVIIPGAWRKPLSEKCAIFAHMGFHFFNRIFSHEA